MRKILVKDGVYALVDEQDYERLSKNRWSLHSQGYAVRVAGKKSILMHREVLRAPKGKLVDHINGDRLDNRRANLRLCSRAQNSWNSWKKSKGTYLHKASQLWHARIGVNNRVISLGYHKTEGDATQAYKKAVRRYHGEFADSRRF